MSTWEASSPSSQDVEEAFDVERLWLGVLDECLVRDFVQAWMPRALPLLVVLDSLPFRGIVELLKLKVRHNGLLGRPLAAAGAARLIGYRRQVK